MVAVFFASCGSSLSQRSFLFFILFLLHFQYCLCFAFDRVQLQTIRIPINNNNINNHMQRHNRYLAGKQRQTRVASTGSSNEVLESEAFSSMRICYQSAAASAFVDGITFNWSSRNWETLVPVDLLGTVWKVGIALSLYRMLPLYQIYIKKIDEETSFQPVYYICKTMARLWLETTWVLAFGCFVDLVGLFRDASSWVEFFAILIAGGGCFSRVADRDTEVVASEDDLQGSAAAAQQMGLVTARNMAYCTGALLVRASIIPLSAFYETTWRGRIEQISNLPTPVVTGALLWQLRKSFLTVLAGVTSLDLQPEAKDELFEAQRSFYSKVASTFKGEAIFKLGFFLAQIVITFTKARKL
jgi:hypothetical protein